MGTRFEIHLLSADAATATRDIEAAFDAIDRLEDRISEWRPHSDVSRLNRMAGRGQVKVGPDLLAILLQAAQVSERTGGAFDISFAACGQFWSIRNERIPSEGQLAACLPYVDHRRVRVSPEVGEALLSGGMRIGIGGIGKGYGVDYAARFLEERGYLTYLVNGGGDIRVRGDRPERTWNLAIMHPRPNNADGGLPVAGVVRLRSGALVGSGDYEQYFERDGVRYHHILDPFTGLPARASSAVQVIAPTAMEADAYATAFFVLGAGRSLEIAETVPGLEVWLMDPEGQPYSTPGFQNALAVDPSVSP